MIDRSEAREILSRLRIAIGTDFHVLRSSTVEALLAEADRYGYRKPANANGSRGRYFYNLLQRRAGAWEVSDAEADREELAADIAKYGLPKFLKGPD